ncbi:hypothetical protein H8A99_35525 [Bradyrhizobium sp. Arg68]|uniref:hypothetical protein n=1 Tax=Bradyrhizobium ivorense TaxID=2511166 RepID=UPI001E448B67|nr:hypothetical protein [Bradyrhizobium ivorense]MCC8941607.1 hypothetical protein [Bradyrhizobium ivorense]
MRKTSITIAAAAMLAALAAPAVASAASYRPHMSDMAMAHAGSYSASDQQGAERSAAPDPYAYHGGPKGNE